jgi:hypothetical protein
MPAFKALEANLQPLPRLSPLQGVALLFALGLMACEPEPLPPPSPDPCLQGNSCGGQIAPMSQARYWHQAPTARSSSQGGSAAPMAPSRRPSWCLPEAAVFS